MVRASFFFCFLEPYSTCVIYLHDVLDRNLPLNHSRLDVKALAEVLEAHLRGLQVHPKKDKLDSSLERINPKNCLVTRKKNIIGLSKIALIQENWIGLNVIFYQNEKNFGFLCNTAEIFYYLQTIALYYVCLKSYVIHRIFFVRF